MTEVAKELGFKEIFKEEIEVAFKNLKEEFKDMSKEMLEKAAKELSDAFGRTAKRTPNMTDDFYNMIKPMLDEQIDKIHDEAK